MAETFSWPEASVYILPAGAGSSAIMTFGQDIELTVDYKWRKDVKFATGALAARTDFQIEDKNVTLKIGALFADQSAFQICNSATAYNARVVYQVTGGLTQTGEFQLWSAVWTHWGVQGNENQIWKVKTEMMAADISGVNW